KRAYWRTREGWTLLEYSPADIARSGVEALRAILLADLAALGVVSRVRGEEEIWQEVRRRAIDNLTKAMTSFVGRCRKRDLNPSGLAELTSAHVPLSRTEDLFLDVAQSVYGGYLRRLHGRGLEDFDGLMWRAARAI